MLLLVSLFFLTFGRKDDTSKVAFKESVVQLSTHKLATYSIESNSKYLVVFESGLGDDHSVWKFKKVVKDISATMDVVVYDRAGYGKSTIDNTPRDINRLSIELASVVNKYAKDRKVILVGHSLGGMVIRDFAIKHPDIVAGVLFIDPSHENYNHPEQAVEDMIYNAFNSSKGADFGGTKEARELIEDAAYMAALPNMPNVPVVVLSSMKTDARHSAIDRQNWYNAHELFKNGVTDFTHVTTTKSGHYIMIDEPRLVIDNLNLLVAKLP
ncbi:alpha/beta fold hydrolase [Chitinophaga nivalis]|uniref:Alpha/beta hydrolase n=1 Tax=Chitinophaga nivalis TaxID=2991709 RepID=A0ABT3IUD1_9BACT|nr:alpha/beta hydrolase [Chitinophaga nivalis]MCW3462980.1 alpha/beta hydrolase [Chitinophaga nivalis]MCW3487330.1 alpha/beta hydrolase [Chitinophaga nivalis]